MKQLFLFDLDGTLIEFHHEYLFREAERIIEEISHPPVERAALSTHFSAFDFFRFVSDRPRDEFEVTFWSMFDWSGFPKPKVFDGVLSVLEELVELGKEVALVTSRMVSPEQVRADLAHTGLLEFISVIQTRTDHELVWHDKRKAIVDVCVQLGVNPQDAVMIGDIPPDITSAKAVGIGKTVAVLSGGIRDDVLKEAQPSIIINGVSEIPTC